MHRLSHAARSVSSLRPRTSPLCRGKYARGIWRLLAPAAVGISPIATTPRLAASQEHNNTGKTDQHGGQGAYSEESAALYSGIDFSEGNFWLIYHHAELAIRKWLTPSGLASARALDWGCGAGRSTRWLRTQLGIQEVHGADVCKEMLVQARAVDQGGTYVHADAGQCPFADESYDLVLSMVVVIELSTRAALHAYAAEAYRLLRPGGYVVAVSATEESHDPANEFLSFRYIIMDPADPHNCRLKSGDKVVNRNNCGLCMDDYYWTRDDIVDSFQTHGFLLSEMCKTLGVENSPFEWRDEMRVATDYVFVFQKPVR